MIGQGTIRRLKMLLMAIVLVFAFALPAVADTASGAEIFGVHCAGCHANGGNIVRRGKTLKQKALEKNGMASLEAIMAIVTNGKNNMSAYKDRLSEPQIATVAAYVLERAAQDWR